ncbi:MAG: hypothetical protein FWG63_01465 [Defluviitaleaceae bacterium]|nr:hypothetical protein [Defluviitaleaceae bacterium]
MKIINFCNYEWYVLEEREDKTLLLLKDTINRRQVTSSSVLKPFSAWCTYDYLNDGFYPSLGEGSVDILDTDREDGVKKIFLLNRKEVSKYCNFIEGQLSSVEFIPIDTLKGSRPSIYVKSNSSHLKVVGEFTSYYKLVISENLPFAELEMSITRRELSPTLTYFASDVKRERGELLCLE